jgi:hypothetical protein
LVQPLVNRQIFGSTPSVDKYLVQPLVNRQIFGTTVLHKKNQSNG